MRGWGRDADPEDVVELLPLLHVDGTAAVHAPWIERDDVEAVQHFGRQYQQLVG